MTASLRLLLLPSPDWTDYELLDSGGGLKLERYGPYRVIRPEPQAMWRRAADREWDEAHLAFRGGEDDEERGWDSRRRTEPRWTMRYKDLAFYVQPTPFRHMGVFPEQAAQWDWIREKMKSAKAGSSPRVLSLFGYTGIATLAAAAAGATVTHVDASKKAVAWARDNQTLSELASKPVRWIVDDALKFVQREARRGAKYDGFILDPPKFGRGPKGEIWRLEESLPKLLHHMRDLISPKPLFAVLTVYALRISSTALFNSLAEWTANLQGDIEAGETILTDRAAGRSISASVFARWNAKEKSA